MITPPTFFAVEIEVFKPGLSAYTYTQGHATHPHGTLSILPDTGQGGVGMILASDMGYRTAPTDANGVQSYAPLVSQAFQVDRKLNIDPNQSPIAAAWGTINLTNADHTFDPIVASWNSDNRNVRIFYGVKGYEDFEGQKVKRASTGTYVGNAGTLQTAAVDVLRYDWTTGDPVALIEAAATNLAPAVAAYGAVNATLTAAAGTAPDGTNTAVRLAETAANSVHYIQGLATTVDATPYTFSIFAKLAEVRYLQMYCDGSSGGAFVNFDLQAGAICQPQTSYGATLGGAAITAIGNGWYRLSQALTITGGMRTGVLTLNGPASGFAPGFVGNPANGVLLWGSDLELGPVASSYTPASRAQDYPFTARRYYTDPPKTSLLPAFFGVCQPWFLGETELQVPVRDATYFAEQPLQTSLYGGTGSYDGTVQLKGAPKPKARGGTAAFPIRNVSPVLLDPPRLIYQYSDGPGTVVHAYEGGAIVWTYEGDTTDLYSGGPAAGHYRTDNSRGLFQLGSSPQRAVTADVTGQFPVAGVVTSACQIARYILTEELKVPPEHMNLASFNLTAPDPGAGVAGVYWSTDNMPSDGVTAAALVTSSFAGHVIPNRQGLLTLILLRDVPITAIAAARFDTVNTVAMTPQPLPTSVSPPAYRVRLAYSSNYTVMTSGVSPAADALNSQFVAGPGPNAVWTSPTVQATWVKPNDIGILPSALLSVDDAQNVVNTLGALWGVRRMLYEVEVPVAIALQRDLGDLVQLVWPADILVQGQLGQIVGESWTSSDGTVKFMVLV